MARQVTRLGHGTYHPPPIYPIFLFSIESGFLEYHSFTTSFLVYQRSFFHLLSTQMLPLGFFQHPLSGCASAISSLNAEVLLSDVTLSSLLSCSFLTLSLLVFNIIVRITFISTASSLLKSAVVSTKGSDP